MTEEDVFKSLARMWETHDPMPEGLAEQVIVALAMEDFESDSELLTLVSSTEASMAGARHVIDADTTLRLEYSNGVVTLLMRVVCEGGGHRRLDGWISPPQSMRIRLHLAGDPDLVRTTVAASGRFEFTALRPGQARIWLESDDDSTASQSVLATTLFEI